MKHQNRQNNQQKQPVYNQPEGSSSRDLKACEYAKNENSLESWQDYLDSFPDGECSFEAKQQIKKIKNESEKKERQALAAKEAEYIRKGRKIGNLIWSDRSSNGMNWSNAKQYCENLTEGGFTDWRLPTISELKTTIQNCQSGGSSCKVSDSCLWADSCWSNSCYCDGRNNNEGYYSKLGDDGNVWLWSSSTPSDYPFHAWHVNFKNGYVKHYITSDKYFVRCVR